MKDFINKVIQGDCLEVMKDIPDKSIDMILCDLPYGTNACKWDTIIPFEPLWEQYKRIIKDNGAICLYWIWHKSIPTGMMSAKYMPMKNHEIISVFGYGKLKFNPIMEERSKNTHKTGQGKTYINSSEHNKGFSVIRKEPPDKRNPTTVRYFPNVSRHQSEHPTQKPVSLCEYLIKTYTNEGDLVLDNCAGSGTTGVVCKNFNRNYILIEKEPEYIDIINKRLL
jgi:site-specific DNA-methyltransferase (adenine-specific)